MRATFLTVLLLLFVATAHAVLPDGLSDSFRPVDGVVIKGSEGEYLLDLGTQNGVREGDLLTVLAPAEEVRHPVTGAVIGRIEQARAFLRVTRIKPDFCWAKPLAGAPAIHPAEPVRRFAEIPAVFLDQRGDGRPLFNELQLALPHLAWRPWGETAPGTPGLVFALETNRLSVRDDSGNLLGTWTLPAPAEQQPGTSAVAPPQAMKLIGPRFKGKAIGVAIADLDGDQRPEIAVALEEQIEIGRLAGETWQPVARCELTSALKALTLDSADLDGDGRAELLLTAVRGDQLASQVWGYDAGSCRTEAAGLPWYWRVMDLPGEPGAILAQNAGPFGDTDYAGQPFRVIWRDGAPRAGEPLVNFAAPTLHGSQPLPWGETPLWAWLNASDDLIVQDAQGERLWESSAKFGGGEAYIERKAKEIKGEARRMFIRSRLAHDGETLILPQNHGPRAMSNWRKASQSRLVGLRWNGYAMDEVWSTPLREGYLADFARTDLDGDGRSDYLLVGTLPTGLFSRAQSALFVWEN